ncbi:MAG: general secretion pathway protein GspB, partial [Candidatus Omnitrophica bacterium]|nr:general secretion pathway protein GspB [Candidatus Omnitrophota bacterium]
RDPFIPLIGCGETTNEGGIASILNIDDVSLQGIAVGGDDSRYAIINGEVIREGQKVERVSIEKIEENEVTLKIDEEIYKVKLYE